MDVFFHLKNLHRIRCCAIFYQFEELEKRGSLDTTSSLRAILRFHFFYNRLPHRVPSSVSFELVLLPSVDCSPVSSANGTRQDGVFPGRCAWQRKPCPRLEEHKERPARACSGWNTFSRYYRINGISPETGRSGKEKLNEEYTRNAEKQQLRRRWIIPLRLSISTFARATPRLLSASLTGERNASQGIALCTYRRWAGLIRFFVLLRSSSVPLKYAPLFRCIIQLGSSTILYYLHIFAVRFYVSISLQLFSMFRILNRLPRFITHMQTESFDRYSR